MRAKVLFILFGAFWVLGTGSARSQADLRVLQDQAFSDWQRPPAVFAHDPHNAQAELYDCSVCHHVYEDGQKVQGAMSVGQKCSDCHSVRQSGGEQPDLLSASHRQCVQSHEERGKGPLTCGQCHVRSQGA